MDNYHPEHSNNEPKSITEYTTNDYYSDSYSRPGIHMAMLADKRRTLIYEEALKSKFCDIEGKSVLDVGSGTGILSMFAAKYGARVVVSVEMSGIAQVAQKIVQDNNYGGVINVFQGRIEDFDDGFELADGEVINKFDVIVSEWMGYALVFEGMLESVVYARERFMKPHGQMLPDQCELFVSGYRKLPSNYTRVEHFWREQYGFNFNAMNDYSKKVYNEFTLSERYFQGNTCCVLSLNLSTITMDELVEYLYEKEHNLTIFMNLDNEQEGVDNSDNDESGDENGAASVQVQVEKASSKPKKITYDAKNDSDIHVKQSLIQKTSNKTCKGLILYFDVSFFHRIEEHRLTFSTRLPSHWDHTLFGFDKINVINDVSEVSLLTGTLKIDRKKECKRNFDFGFNLTALSRDFVQMKEIKQTWSMS